MEKNTKKLFAMIAMLLLVFALIGCGSSDPDTDQQDKSPEVGGITFNVKDVRNDSTGNWRIAVISDSIDMTENALDYYNAYFGSDDEIHAIVNFTYNTTTKINVLTDSLDVTVYEYVEDEEHDANIMFTGEMLTESYVNIETGEITKIF